MVSDLSYIEGVGEGPDLLPLSTQELIDTGLWLSLPGSIGRSCMAAIEAGYAMLPPKRQTSYYGAVVPSRSDVEAGTPGSVEYFEATLKDRRHR